MGNHRIHRYLSPAQSIHEFWVEAPLVARKHRAGQFVIVRLSEHGERIPLTIAESDPERGLIRLIVQVAGKTTLEMSRLREGDSLLDVVGPLGKATHVEKWGNLAAIGGGVGCAPLLPVVKAAREAGNRVLAVIGARSHSLMILEDEFRAACDEVRVCTDDGSYGRHGLVTDVLKEWVGEGQHFDQAVLIGPLPMMKAAAALTKELGIPAMASLNPIMVDGTGMCGGCRVTVHGKTYFACVDGPEFDAHGVDFRELTLRNQAYRAFEEKAMKQAMNHECRLEEQMRRMAPHV